MLITGFISLYTKGVEDIDYQNYLAAILFSFNIILDCMRGASLAGANVAGQAPKTTWRYFVEAGINLSVSLILVRFWGIVGVLFGTIIAGIWRSFDSIVFFSKRVLHEKPYKELIYDICNFSVFILFVIIGKLNLLPIGNYLQLILWGILSFLVVSGVYIFIFATANRKNIKSFFRMLRNKQQS